MAQVGAGTERIGKKIKEKKTQYDVMNLETLSQILDLKDDFLKIPWIIGDKWVHESKDD